MELDRRGLLLASLAAAALPAFAPRAAARAAVTPAEALAILKAGNAAFVAGKPAVYPFDLARRRELAQGQHPIATIVCCSDSRAGPELIFETGLGELFVIRNAGSTVANPQALGSIEYAAEHLHVPLIVVLGHSKCGAVNAAIDVADKHATLPGSLGAMVSPILPAVVTAHRQQGDLLGNAVRENIRNVVKDLRAPTQPLLHEGLAKGTLRVVGAVYDLESGVVDFFDEG